jgi:hypothetical protein
MTYTKLHLALLQRDLRKKGTRVGKLLCWRVSSMCKPGDPWYEVRCDGELVWQGHASSATHAKCLYLEKLL